MLVLTRRVQEDIIVELEDGRTITIRVKELRRHQARIGVAAPKACRVLRKELYDRDQEETTKC